MTGIPSIINSQNVKEKNFRIQLLSQFIFPYLEEIGTLNHRRKRKFFIEKYPLSGKYSLTISLDMLI